MHQNPQESFRRKVELKAERENLAHQVMQLDALFAMEGFRSVVLEAVDWNPDTHDNDGYPIPPILRSVKWEANVHYGLEGEFERITKEYITSLLCMMRERVVDLEEQISHIP